MDNAQMRYISRAIIIEGNEVLLAKGKTKKNYFLPGGGLESNESPEFALHREILEELDFQINIERLELTHDNKFYTDGHTSFEKVYVFSASINTPGCKLVMSREKQIEFCWKRIDEINKFLILPEIHKSLILRVAAKDKLNN